ncbi:alpha-(1-_3)-arabinofuranosyltransferase [Nocardioides panacihumi]|uniref:Alpha-(1->3)-arabinofuranosyltransferase n=1 Tax=Nocardioides panacihumi TaxID=400774 RepID=A0ABN2QZH6_9ACTN
MNGAWVADRTERARDARRQRMVSLVVVVAVVALNLAQQPGLITFDTKLDLQFNPGAFLSRSLNVWNGDWTLGGLQNQASGYLVPMGPVFWLGAVAHVPMWIWERLWTAALMLLAYFGTVRLARNWPGINAAGAVLAGLTYMLAPRVLITVGGLSGETLPSVILPWTLLPLVLYLRGRLPTLAAFVLSAATIPWMGGQNATLVIACLILPGLLLLLVSGRTLLRRVRDTLAWTGLALVASLWWIIPLVVMGGYAPPFLNFIESASNTASRIGWLNSFRGTSHWVAFFPGGDSAGWVGGYELVSSATLLVTTVLVAGAGLLGLAQPTLWARRTLVISLLIGLAVLTMGSAEPAGSVLGGQWLEFLDSSLAALRNVHKFDPIVRLPLSLGLGAFVTAGIPQLLAGIRSLSVRGRTLVGTFATGALVLLVCAAAQPAASGDLRVADGVRDISPSWRQAIAFLQAQSGPSGVMVLPGSGFAVQTWGRTIDEPIQVLDGPPWTVRSQSTVANAGTLRLLDAIENQVAAGHPIQGFASALRRMGITYVVLRNDLVPDANNAASAAAVRASVSEDSGLRHVADFGRTADGYPEVEVLALADDGQDPRVSITDSADSVVVQGGPEVVNDLAELGLVAPHRDVMLADEPGAEDQVRPADIVTDSNRRVERSFARIIDGVSGPMTADERYRVDRPIHDFVGDSVPTATTVAEYEGARLVTASSSGGYADVLGAIRTDEHPYAAFDASAFTAWTTSPFVSPIGQWIEVQYNEPVEPRPVALLFDNRGGADVSKVRLTTDAGSVDATVGTDGVAQGVQLPAGLTTSLRMTVLAQRPSAAREVRLANFSVGGEKIRRTLRVPGEVTPGSTMLFRSEEPRRGCLTDGSAVTCSAAWERETPETPGFDRTVTVAEGGTWRLHGRVVATNGPTLDRLFEPLSPRQVRVEASSTYAGDPAVVGANAFDGRDDTSWYASPFDRKPTLQLSWKRPRTITSVKALLGADQPGELPGTLVVDPMEDGIKPQLVATSGDFAGLMRPVRTKRLQISVLPDEQRGTVGIGELKIGGLAALRHETEPDTPTGQACGFGPKIEVDGRTVDTKIVGTIKDVVDGAELSLEPCGDDAVHLAAGTQRIRVTNPAGFAVSRLWLEPAAPTSPTAPTVGGGSSVHVLSWSPTTRSVKVRSSGQAVLSMAQSVNRGWEARVGGKLLTPITVDGWKQGWRLPAGTSGNVSLQYAPQSMFQWGIVVGFSLAAGLTLLALMLLVRSAGRGSRRRRASRRATSVRPVGLLPVAPTRPARGPHRLLMMIGAASLALVSVPLGVGALAGFAFRRLSLAAISAACASGVAAATVVTLADVGGPRNPPVVADVITAVVVGLVAGRALFGEDELGPDLE